MIKSNFVKFVLFLVFPIFVNALTFDTTGFQCVSGTWTPTLTASTPPTLGYTNRVGTYVKCGVFVVVYGRITLSSTSGGSGSLQISGLPFTIQNVTNYFGVGTVTFKENWTTLGPTNLRGVANGTTITGLSAHTATANTDITTSNLAATSDMIFTFNYISSN